MRIDEDTVDPGLSEPYVDVNELRASPVPHRYVHGGFKGTEARFSFYFPPEERYGGRFHHNTYPLAMSEDIGPFPIAFDVSTGNLGFTLDSGAYYVQTNMGGVFRPPGRAAGAQPSPHPSMAAYRVNAAAARYSRVVAAQLYGEHRPFGYLYGGSGGAFQSLGAAENTRGVWDGFMPYVSGSNNLLPSSFTVRMHALRVLRRRNKFPAIMDALEPGGSGNVYAELNAEERAAFEEATRLGFPPRAWYAHATLNSGYFADVAPMVPNTDPTYIEDFWNKPGYLGADPGASIREERYQFDTTVARVLDGQPTRIELASVPERNVLDAVLFVRSGKAAGARFAITRIDGKTLGFARPSDAAMLGALRRGDEVRIDNSWPLALETYQRHVVPRDRSEYAWDQYRDAAGQPLYPQRQTPIGPAVTVNAVGAELSGRIGGKVLMVQGLMDIDAFPWVADWYRSKVKQELGAGFEESFALWFIDHTQHDNPQTPLARAHAVSLSGALQQGLRDLALWVEKGQRPSETRYKVVDGQIEVPADARARGGVQPVVELHANGGSRAEVRVGEPVAFSASIEVPLDAGTVVAAEWDFLGTGDYPVKADVSAPGALLRLSATHAYPEPGIYFPVLRVASHRDGNTKTPYALIQNIARVRVVVRPEWE